jgi:Uma2 family endonuclease
MSAQLEPRRFNVTEYYLMAEAGILTADDRVELIEGEIIKMSPIGSEHAACVCRLDGLLREKLGKHTLVRVQSPVRLSYFSEPEPDIALIEPRADCYAKHHPTPEEIQLIIEVADSTLLADRNIKVPLYGRAGVVEIWLVNLREGTIEVYSEAHNGKYRKCQKHKRGETVKSPTVQELSLTVDEILG